MRYLFCYEALKFDRKCRYLIISPLENYTNMNDNDQTMKFTKEATIYLTVEIQNSKTTQSYKLTTVYNNIKISTNNIH